MENYKMEDKKPNKGGRPKGSKDTYARTRDDKKKLPSKSKEVAEVKPTKNNSLVNDNLKGDVKKLHKKFSTKYGKTLEEMIELANGIRADIRLSETSHKNAWESKIRLAKEALKEVIETNTIGGKTANPAAIATRKRNLQKEIDSPFTIDSKITTLRAEYLKVLSEIDRMESGRAPGDVNIWQIINGQADPDQTEVFKKRIKDDSMPEELMDAEDYEDIDITEGESDDA
jgi:hypothetical protein